MPVIDLIDASDISTTLRYAMDPLWSLCSAASMQSRHVNTASHLSEVAKVSLRHSTASVQSMIANSACGRRSSEHTAARRTMSE